MDSCPDRRIKYSIIVPTFNGYEYLKDCVRTILNQDFINYELIISDDHSTDSTPHFLSSIRDNRVRILHTQTRLSMAEHWEWALGHAKGEWLLFVGQDDGLMPYFFPLAEKLTALADLRGIRIIASRRAYFFWSGCEGTYGDIALSYFARDLVVEKSLGWMAFKALTGAIDYFEIPSMYTTSLFRREIPAQARLRQGGTLFVTHPQDANLAAIGCSLSRKCLYSYIPLGWVGSSPKSAGLAVTDAKNRENQQVRSSYLESVRASRLVLHSRIGDFSIGSTILYFWGALLSTSKVRFSPLFDRVLRSRLIGRIIVFAAAVELESQRNCLSFERRKKFLEVATANGIIGKHSLAVGAFFIRAINRLIKYIDRAAQAVRFGGNSLGLLEVTDSRRSIFIKRSDRPSMTLCEAQAVIRDIMRNSDDR
jgi:glycosyltransferase involved in cell wall biosynthesis